MARKNIVVLPSVLSFPFGNIDGELAKMTKAGIRIFHYDVMDGHFVPNISFGESLFTQIVKPGFQADVHLMVTNPLPHALAFFRLGAEQVTVHYEAIKTGAMDFLDAIGHCRRGKVLGLAFNPETEPEEIEKLVPYFDKVMVMTVHPGASGGKFIADGIERIKKTKEMLERTNPAAILEVDGGMNEVTGPLAVQAGADYLVSGSYLCKAVDPVLAIANLTGNRQA